MKRILSTLNKRGNSQRGHEGPTQASLQENSLEVTIVLEIAAFCESSAPNSPSAGDEFLHLPAIVDAAESSPEAARQGANCIRKYLTKGYTALPYAQYNAVMLMRILTDNPGRTFTRNMDATFVKTVKGLLREGRDLSVQQILRETLDTFAADKKDNETLGPLNEMWHKEKARTNTQTHGNMVGPLATNGTTRAAQAGNHFARNHRQPRSLPGPEELTARIEEAKTTARLLSQTVQSTPTTEIADNDLIREFAERASSASRSMQAYVHITNPPPDEDTMLTLIETNDLLSVAMSKHQRALLQARRAANASPATSQPPQTQNVAHAAAPASPPRIWSSRPSVDRGLSPPPRARDHVYTPSLHLPPQQEQREQSPHWEQNGHDQATLNPFADNASQHAAPLQQSYGLFRQPNHASPLDRREQDLPQIEPLQPRTQRHEPPSHSPSSHPYRQESTGENTNPYGSPHLLDRQDPGVSPQVTPYIGR